MTDTENTRERMKDIRQRLKDMRNSRFVDGRFCKKVAFNTLEKVLDEAEPWADDNPNHGLADEIIEIIQNELCEEE